jgi:beta-N-acetylhexosaminidase
MDSRYVAGGVVLAAAVAFVVGFSCTRALDDSGDTPRPTATAADTPAPQPSPTPTPGSGVSLEVKIGQLIMTGMEGTTAEEAAGLVRTYRIGNVVLLGRNVVTPEQVLALTSGLQQMAREANGAGMLVGIDQEGGRVIRLGPPFTQAPAAAVIGCIGDTELARRAALVMGREMLAAGVNVDLAPDADVLTEPSNTVIGDRAFGTTPEQVTPMVLASIEGLHEAGVLAVPKHFPGHGSTSGDSHDGPVVAERSLQELEDVDLPPFRAAVATVDMVMVSNVDYPALEPADLPASLSGLTIGYLREALGFDGVVITDALEMGAVSSRWTAGEAAVRAIEAGADMVLYADLGGGIAAAQALLLAVRGGRISEARIDESLERVAALKERALAQPLPGLEVVGSAESQAFTADLAQARADTGC